MLIAIALPLLMVVVRLPLGLALTDQLRAFGANATSLLDSLLSPATYNKNIRPNIGGNPVTVSVNMYIKSIGAISDNDEEYTMDLYFRQSWQDSRLKFRLHGVEEMSMSWLFVDKVWKPDTFFTNGKKSSLHKVTSANKFVRLRKNGYLTLSMRLTVSASCKMHLRKFPLDTQNCSLLIGSYAYTSSDIIYKWSTEGEPVATEPGMEMAQHTLIATRIRKKFLLKRDTDEYNVIRANFIFQRSIGFFVLQVYVPCSLIICCSWVSFWINPDDVPARIQLGVIPVLSITTIGFGNRSALPKVSHATALDWFLILCFAFAFGVILEYAYINFVNKIYSDGRKVYEAKKILAKVVETITQCSHQNPTECDDEAYGTMGKAPEIKPTSEKVPITEEEVVETSKNDGTQNCAPHDLETKVIMELEPENEELDSASFSFIDQEIKDSARIPLADDGNSPESNFLPDLNVKSPGIALTWVDKLRETNLSKLMKERFLAPVRLWRKVNILPDESDIIKRIEEENPQKFPDIDIKSRVIFPTCFSFAVMLYFVSYFYIIDDETVDFDELDSI